MTATNYLCPVCGKDPCGCDDDDEPVLDDPDATVTDPTRPDLGGSD